jgi:hypothetical protein
MDTKTEEYLKKMGATSFLTEENKAKFNQLSEDVQSFERAFQIKSKNSWDSAAEVVLNS